MIFVFGSNQAGVHGAGAAKFAHKHRGAKFGLGYGFSGESFAIPTKNHTITSTLPLATIKHYVESFIEFASKNSHLDFKVTRIGCGLAGLKDKDIAPMFKRAPDNCYFDLYWEKFLGEDKNYWGTFDN
jgi:hypothetical protein